MNQLQDDAFIERVRQFREFLDSEGQMRDSVVRLVKGGALRLAVSLNQLRVFNREYADGLLAAPVDFLPPLDKALHDAVLALDPEYPLVSVALHGAFGLNQVILST